LSYKEPIVELWELVARESVRDLIVRYNANGDSGRWAQVEELFAPDAVMDVDGRIFSGREEIMAMFRETQRRVVPQASAAPVPDAPPVGHTTMEEWVGRGRKPFIRHMTGTTQIDVLSPTEARARSYYLLLTVHGLDHWGRYVDEFGRLDGRWVFTRRQEVQEAAFENGWGANGVEGNVVRGLGFALDPHAR
jgi:hypothetical protein